MTIVINVYFVVCCRSLTSTEVRTGVVRTGLRPKVPPCLCTESRRFLQCLWNADPRLRPTFESIVYHLGVFVSVTNKSMPANAPDQIAGLVANLEIADKSAGRTQPTDNPAIAVPKRRGRTRRALAKRGFGRLVRGRKLNATKKRLRESVMDGAQVRVLPITQLTVLASVTMVVYS